jgi:hypothetical protein
VVEERFAVLGGPPAEDIAGRLARELAEEAAGREVAIGGVLDIAAADALDEPLADLEEL